ncbi:acetyltransferase [Idiomarina aminovorans]|uniref:acetyltransferase n=1 Tax=Idiomarina aminovorans TaxID=2914829 RepID=UPI0020030CFE|nr:acetyltransferase [Idiomarina sp. ATCH4]MCK7459132.1 acetyltransferase [Idiomarina sp. ATCH4]
MAKPYIVLGGGGHARALIEILSSHNAVVEAMVAPELIPAPEFKSLKHLTHDDDINQYPTASVELVNAIGSLPKDAKLRETLFKRFKSAGYHFAAVVSKAAILSKYAELAEGVQILPGAILNACQVGANTIINTGAIVEHDVKIGENCHIAPGAVICGDVCIGNNVHIGAGATVLQGLSIADSAVVGAGSVVTKNLSAGAINYPAKSFIKEENE